MDLCSIANISIYILDENVHGYYIHGMSPQGVSEGTFEELKRGFNAESKGIFIIIIKKDFLMK